MRRQREDSVLLGTPGSAEQYAEISRIDSVAMLAIGLVSLTLIGLVALDGVQPPDYRPEVIAGFGSAAVIISVFTWRQVLPPSLTRYAYPLAVLAVLAGVWAGGPTFGPVISMFLMWFGGTVVHTPRRFAIGLIAFVVISHGVLLALQDGNPMPFAQWQLMAVLVITFALSSDRMVRRSQMLAESERTARASAERARADLEQVNDQKTEFLGRMSHELRTPLNAVIGFSEVLAAGTYGPLTAKQAEYSADIVESGGHLLSLVDELLDVSKVETGNLELHVAWVDVGELLRSCVALVQEEARRRRIDVELDVSPVSGVLRADERKLRQVVLNLLSNALKFTPSRGHVYVRASATGGGVAIRVEDTGPGIAAQEHDAIFEEFHQASASPSGVRGTGLGLPLARRFVELHGGRLWVESEGHGTAFTAELPRHAQPPVLHTDPSPAAKAGSALRAFGEPDSEDRRRETARIAAIVGGGVGLAGVITTILLMLFPAQARGARPGLVAVDVAVMVLIVAAVATRPQALASPTSLLWCSAIVVMSLPVTAYALGPYWGPLLAPLYAWFAGVSVLMFSRGWFAVMLGLAGVSDVLSLWVMGDVDAPVARLLSTIGFAIATGVLFSRLTLRIQRMTDDDRDARADAERITDQLRLASRHKSEFLANMSHELRTPLNAVIGFSEVLESEAFGPLNEKQAEYVADVLSSGRHLLSLINDILDLAKAEAGHVELHPTQADIGDAIRTAVSRSAPLADARRIALDADIRKLGAAEIDEPKLQHVLASLLSNAVKFAPKGGTVSIGARQRGEMVEISVRDTGPGVDPDDRERIFEAFVHGVGSESTRQGAGLGLALARRYAELHGGTLTVDSRPGAGATFTLSLPARQHAALGTAS